MKKLNLMVAILLATIVFVSCEKSTEELTSDVVKESVERTIELTPVFNKENPFDIYGEQMKEFYLAENKLFQNPLYKDRIKFDFAFDSLLVKYNDILYPNIDSTKIDEYQTSFLHELFLEVNFKNLKELSLKTENLIISDTKTNIEQKNRLLSIVY